MGALFGMLCATYIGLYYGVWDANMMRAADLPGDAAFRAELNVATQIQSSMLPCVFPAFPEYETFDIYASMNPAKEVAAPFTISSLWTRIIWRSSWRTCPARACRRRL